MNPRAFLELANELCGDDREEAWRTAAGRAYYAVFHGARDLLGQAEFEVPTSERAHAYLWLRLENSAHPDIESAGARLKELRTMRNWADYDLNQPFAHAQATGQVLAALGVLDILESVMESPETLQRITDAIRVYERDVLRVVSYREAP